MIGVVWVDDKQAEKVIVRKYYSKNSRADISME
jgi:Holliday junction resolvase RusA-like endonuclease